MTGERRGMTVPQAGPSLNPPCSLYEDHQEVTLSLSKSDLLQTLLQRRVRRTGNEQVIH